MIASLLLGYTEAIKRYPPTKYVCGMPAMIEYLHLDLGKKDYFQQAGCSVGNCPVTLKVDTVKVGINYRFGSY